MAISNLDVSHEFDTLGFRFGNSDCLQLKFELFEILCLILIFGEKHPKVLYRKDLRYKMALPNLPSLTNLFRLGRVVYPLCRNGFKCISPQVAANCNLNGKASGKVGAYRSPALPDAFHIFSLMICSYSRTYFSRMTRSVW